MTGAVPLVINLLKAAIPVTAIVDNRIDPEIAKAGGKLPRIVVRQSTGRQVYGLNGSTGLTDGRLTVLCGAEHYTTAERLAQAVIAALKDVRHVEVAGNAVTLFQDGEDAGTWDQDGKTFTRIIGFRAVIGARA